SSWTPSSARRRRSAPRLGALPWGSWKCPSSPLIVGPRMATLIRVDDRIDVPDRLPVVALRDLVFFPYVVLPILVGRHRSVAALDEAREEEGMVLLLAQKDPGVDEPGSADLFRVGTVARALQ